MDKFWENYITTRPTDSKGAFEEFKQMHQDPRSMAQGPRNMQLAKADIPRHLWTNMNTPDLEQSPDSFLRPGETLEDFVNKHNIICTFHYHKQSLVKPNYYCEEKGDDWIVYPWETTDSEEIQDYLKENE